MTTSTSLTVHPVPSMGAEDVLVGPDGTVWTGTEDGAIWAIDPTDGSTRRVADTDGRPLGLELLPDGRLLVCDARRGLLAVDPGSGAIEVLLDRIEGEPMRFCNNAAVASDGTIWFSDSSRHYGIEKWKDDFVQDTHTGRLVRRDPDGTVTVVLDGLRFSNGVALAADESYVAVAECRGRTVVRLWLTGPRAGERDHLVTDLPGYPDNISRGSDGLIWVSRRQPGRRARRAARLGADGAAQGGDEDPRAAPARAEAHHPGAGVRRRREAGARRRRRPPRLPHGHRGPRARGPGVAGQPPRGCGGRPRPAMK